MLAIAEVVLRIVFPLPEIENFNRLYYSPKLSSELVSMQSLRNCSFSWSSDPDHFASLFELNLYGFRDGPWSVAKREPRLVLVGDSFTEGMMASADETIAAGFQGRAASLEEPIDVMNAGIGGSSFRHHVVLIRDIVPLFRPEHLVLVLYANDLPPTDVDLGVLESPLEPEPNAPFVPRIYECLRRVARGERLATRWIASPFPYFPAAPDPGNRWVEHPLRERNEDELDPFMVEALLAGRFNTSWVDEIAFSERQLSKPLEIEGALLALRDYTQRHGTSLAICYVPERYQVSEAYLEFASPLSRRAAETVSLMDERYQGHARALSAACEELGIPCLDLTPVLREREARGVRCYWNFDKHMRGDTYSFIGATLFDWVWASRPHPRD